MKKLLTIATLCGLASASFGQGYVQVANTTGSKVSAGGVVISDVTSPGTNGYIFELLTAPTTTTTIGSSLAGWTDTTDYIGISTTGNGRTAAQNATPDNVGALVPGLPTTGTADFAVVGWSINIATTYAGFLNWYNGGQENGPVTGSGGATGFVGISSVATGVAAAPSGGPYNNIWGPTTSGDIQGMNLGLVTLTVPEPTTFALAGLGAAALVIFRRRK
jgi:hypothetical protein